jgi:chromosome segregation ATPase
MPKQMQLELIQASAVEQFAGIENQREVAASMREMLRNEKTEYLGTHKKAQEMPTSSVRESTRKVAEEMQEPFLKIPGPRFIGGGFSVSQIRPPTSIENQKNIHDLND